MGSVPMNRSDPTSVESELASALTRADRALRGVAPVISHMLDASGEALVNDAILARLRGMLSHIARQAFAAIEQTERSYEPGLGEVDAFTDQLAEDTAILGHLYAVAVEGLLTEKLEREAAIDPVLSPLLQELIASDHPQIAELAMKVLAAQSRFMQSQSRMELALEELPASLFERVLKQADCFAGCDDARHGLLKLKRGFDEAAGRLGLLARLTSGMRKGAIAGLSMDHAGLGLFVSCIAELSGQAREVAVLSCHERQSARLAIALRSLGLENEQIEKQLQMLGPGALHADNLSSISPEHARAMLERSDAVDAFQGEAA